MLPSSSYTKESEKTNKKKISISSGCPCFAGMFRLVCFAVERKGHCAGYRPMLVHRRSVGDQEAGE